MTSPKGESHELSKGEAAAMSLLALSHTPVEHKIYRAMLDVATAAETSIGLFSVRTLMLLTGLNAYGTVRRGLAGLLDKMSIERQKVANDESLQVAGALYRIFYPEEIFSRRRTSGLAPYPREVEALENNSGFNVALERVIARHDLSRREAQVTLLCAEGLTNAEIGEKLCVSEQTVKFHLRHIFVKFGVRRRAELVSRLLKQGGEFATKA